jgi:ABC-type transport system involved in multi-copper enzyme maturation permease subunit
MAVYKRMYKAYTGPVSSPGFRWLAITRFSMAQAFRTRASVVMFSACLVPVLISAIGIYVANSDTARVLLNLHGGSVTVIDNRFFLQLLQLQSWLALFLTAWIGPAMISPDLTNGALPLFLSRPISRAQYVTGKIMVLAAVLSAVTWVPMLLLFLLQAELAKAWIGKNLFIAGAIVLGSVVWIAVLSLISLTISAWVKWRIVATGLMIALVFIPAGFGAVITQVLRTPWGLVLNIPYMITLVWTNLLHVEHMFRWVLPIWAAWISLLTVCGLCLVLLNIRIEARQVVRG